MSLTHGERCGTLTVLGQVRTKNGLKFRVGCTCGFSKQLVRASRFNRGQEKCVRGCAKRKASIS